MIRTAVVLVLLAGIEARAQDLATPPVFFALSVPNLEEAAQWYKDMLDLTETRLPASDVARVALLRGNGLLVELIEHSEAFDLETPVPEGTRRFLVHGTFKVGFFVLDLDATVERLEQRGARFRGTVFSDPVLAARSILVLDNNDNIIQLFERVSQD